MAHLMSSRDFIKLLGNRLLYILRNGAVKDGLTLFPEGFVLVSELLEHNLMKWYTQKEIVKKVETTFRMNGEKMFEIKKSDISGMMIRATSGLAMEKSVYHENSHVTRLFCITVNYVCDHIKLFDLCDFPDEFIMSKIYRKLKIDNKLTNAKLKFLINPCMETYNFHHLYITENTLRLVSLKCGNLKKLVLRDCGYLVTDKIVHMLAKNLHNLKVLDLLNCDSITDNSLKSITKFGMPLNTLNISGCTRITEDGVHTFTKQCHTLKILGAQNLPDFMDDLFVAELKGQHSMISAEPLDIYFKKYDNNYIHP